MPNTIGTQIARSLDYILCKAAAVTFNSIQYFNKRNPNPSVTPQWSDKPLLKSWEKTKPTLGFPRQTDSLCPGCVKEARNEIIAGKKDWRDLMSEKVGEIKAQIIERDGQVWMVKDCPIHGHYEDLMAIDANFLKWIESQFPGRDIPAHNDEDLHKHGSSTVRYGRGSVLTVDLTNRCNMMCDPCFMDANQVGYVHELGWDEVKEILDNALKIKPRRQMSVQFSGGEPTMSPLFLDAVAYARKIGYNSVQAATNGIEFAKSKEFSRKAFEAGMRYAYLQFDGIGNDANSHRQIGNLFDVKLRAIENMHEAGIEIVLVVTIVNNVNNDQVGTVVKFAMENPRRSLSSASSRFPLLAATKTSLRNAASASATLCRTSRRTSARKSAKSNRRATGSPSLSSPPSRASRTWSRATNPSGVRSLAAATRIAASVPPS